MKPVVFLVALLFTTCCSGAQDGGLYTIYLVRHAEKLVDGTKDPVLTVCGKERAEALAVILNSVNLYHIYSSDYRRTRQTAAPTAAQQDIDVEFYDPENLAELATSLQAIQRDVLVVGHSNTTAVLAGLLIADNSFGVFDESHYDRLYQVVFSGGDGRVHLLHQNFECSV